MPSLALTRSLVKAGICAALALGLLANTAAAGEKQNILVLASRDSQQPAYELFMNGFRAGVIARASDRPELFTEFLDSARFPQAEHSIRMLQSLREKYAAIRIDLVISTSPFALNFILQHRNTLFPNVPVVYSLVSTYEAACAASAERRDWRSRTIRSREDSRDGTAPATARTPSRGRFGHSRVRQDVGGRCRARAAEQCPRTRGQIFVGTAARSAS